MLLSHGLGLITIVVLVVGWVGVQSAWKKVFPAGCTDPDVLAGRMGCHGPVCSQDCGHGPRAEGTQEERR
jgi:hypothetical protein